MSSVQEILAVKRDGGVLSKNQINAFIKSIVQSSVGDAQIGAMLMAIFLNGLNELELSHWTKAMLESGLYLQKDQHIRPAVDKHSTGGVGDKVSLVLTPALATCGVNVPMMSGRTLGHTGGTLNKLESIPSFKTDLTPSQMLKNVNQVGAVMVGQSKEMVLADKILYALRDQTATINSVPLIASSIMSKKLSEGLSALLLDIKVGRGAFLPNIKIAKELGTVMISLGRSHGVATTAVYTNMDFPLGQSVGNSLEVKEAIDVLGGQGPQAVRTLVSFFGAHLLLSSGLVETLAEGEGQVLTCLDNGRALETFANIIRAQNGNCKVVKNPGLMPIAPEQTPVPALSSGFVTHIDALSVAQAANILGANPNYAKVYSSKVGVVLTVKIGEYIQQGQTLATLHHQNQGFEKAYYLVQKAYQTATSKVAEPPLILGVDSCFPELSW